MLVGVTGQIGAGKSAVANLLGRKGALVVDADKVGKEVTGSPEVLRKLVAAWDKSILTKSGNLRPSRLAELVFSDSSGIELDRFNSIIRVPLGRAISEALHLAERSLRKKRGSAPVVLDAALLPDWGAASQMELIILVSATREIRLKRLILRGMQTQDARARMGRQRSLKRYREIADVEISNNSTPAELDAKVDRLWKRRILPLL